jgi:hypothetical protein
LSVSARILAGVAGTTWAELTPAWVVPPVERLSDYGQIALRLVEITGCVQARGQCAALRWVFGMDPAPVTGRQGRVTREAARAESWLAVCMAAGRPFAVVREWERLGIEPGPIGPEDAWWAHGVWRTLSWLLGERDDPPCRLPARAADGAVVPGGEVWTARPDPSSAVWRAAEAERERRELAEASEYWRASHQLAQDRG